MMNKKGIITILIVTLFATIAAAQGRMDLRINEVMVENENNVTDEYGKHPAWIEIFNASHGTNAIEKMFITNKRIDNDKRVDVKTLKDDPAFHEIRRGDAATKVAPRGHVLFFADGDSVRGTFHLPFTLEAGKENYIALYDVNGELVDEVVVPASLSADQSWARTSEEVIDLHKSSRNYDKNEWSVRDGKCEATAITPGKFNTRPVNTNIQEFKEKDSHGFIITLTAMGVVFLALALLFVCFMLFGKAFDASAKKKNAPATSSDEDKEEDTVHHAQPGSNDEAIAALCMALYQHFNAHDEESGILTFDHTHDMPSAWSSKGNLLGHLPEHHEI